MDPAIKQIADAIIQGATGGLGKISSGDAAVDTAFGAAQNAGFFKQGSNAAGGLAGQIAKNEEEQREVAAKRAAAKKDPGQYQVKRKGDGGFAFFDPEGKEIGIDQYTQATGVRAYDVLKDSENPVDLQYLDEYENLRTLIEAINDNDAMYVSEFNRQNPGLAGRSPDELMRAFISRYPHIYGNGSYDETRKNFGSTLFRNFEPGVGLDPLAGFDSDFGG